MTDSAQKLSYLVGRPDPELEKNLIFHIDFKYLQAIKDMQKWG
jgi:hypothetical protein